MEPYSQWLNRKIQFMHFIREGRKQNCFSRIGKPAGAWNSVFNCWQTFWRKFPPSLSRSFLAPAKVVCSGPRQERRSGKTWFPSSYMQWNKISRRSPGPEHRWTLHSQTESGERYQTQPSGSFKSRSSRKEKESCCEEEVVGIKIQKWNIVEQGGTSVPKPGWKWAGNSSLKKDKDDLADEGRKTSRRANRETERGLKLNDERRKEEEGKVFFEESSKVTRQKRHLNKLRIHNRDHINSQSRWLREKFAPILNDE